jgi:gluconate 2-dehydrogenase gamma chain
VRFIDRYLSGIGFIYASADGEGFLRIEGKEAESWERRVTALQERYRSGLRDLDARSQEMFQRPFTDLEPEQQDDVLAALSGWPKPSRVDIQPVVDGREEAGGVPSAGGVPGAGGAPPSNQPIRDDELEFFPMLVLHTRQGFYSDPVYGGNRDHIGWQVVGFPGPSSLAQTQRGEFTTLEYMLPDATWNDTGR